MKACFADSFYFLALISSRDHWHRRAVRLSESLTCTMLTTTWVLTEALTGDHHFEQAGVVALLK